MAELEPHRSPLIGIVHLWSMDIGEPGLTEDPLASAQSLGCGSLLAVFQEMILSAAEMPGSLVLVTAGVHSFEDADGEPTVFESALWGFGRTILQEYPGLRCRMVDLSGGCVDSELEALADEIVGDGPDGPEEEVALRGSKRLVHRLRATSLAQIADAAPRVRALPGEAWHAETATASLDRLYFKKTPRHVLDPDDVEIAVGAASLNFRDVVLAMGVVPGLESDNTFGKKQLGSDFAGTVTRLAAGAAICKSGTRCSVSRRQVSPRMPSRNRVCSCASRPTLRWNRRRACRSPS